MAVAEALLHDIERQLDTTIFEVAPVSGGSINDVYCLTTTGLKYLLKVNDRYRYPDMFKLEQDGLISIAATNTIAVPDVVLQGDVANDSYLLLQWIEAGPVTAKASILLGQQLAALHRCSAPQFGFATDNYMGSLPQSNRQHPTWSSFFIKERLQPMVKIALDKNELTTRDAANFEILYQKLSGFFTEEPPALLHGDLWGGNYLIGTDGTPYLIDPAVSYGHREFDIAMTSLFGGFSEAFYEAYNEAYPLQPGWQQRISLWNLYPLLLHLNLFGKSYTSQVRQNLAAYI